MNVHFHYHWLIMFIHHLGFFPIHILGSLKHRHSYLQLRQTVKVQIISVYLQVPYAGFLLGSLRTRQEIRMFPGSPDHLRPSDGFLQLHQTFLVLVALHKDSCHFNPRESLPLCHWQVILSTEYTCTAYQHLFFRKQNQLHIHIGCNR